MNVSQFVERNFERYTYTGNNVRVVCPFHNDHQPGHLYVNTESGLWYCHHASCGASGNFYKLLAKLNKSDYADQIDLTPPPISIDTATEKQRVIPESFLACYSKYPVELLEKGYSLELLKSKGVRVDEVNQRTIFPIRDHVGNLVGISGKDLYRGWGESPKYKIYTSEIQKVYPDYEIDKSKYLYNIDDVFPIMYSTSNHPLFIVEGFKACLWMVQQGYAMTVALMGSTISKFHLSMLSKLTNTFYLFLDTDEGGKQATIKAGKILQQHGSVYVLKGSKDQPDNYTKQELVEIINQKQTFLEHLLGES